MSICTGKSNAYNSCSECIPFYRLGGSWSTASYASGEQRTRSPDHPRLYRPLEWNRRPALHACPCIQTEQGKRSIKHIYTFVPLGKNLNSINFLRGLDSFFWRRPPTWGDKPVWGTGSDPGALKRAWWSPSPFPAYPSPALIRTWTHSHEISVKRHKSN